MFTESDIMMTRSEIETALQLLEKEYLRIADIYYEFRKDSSVENFESQKDEYLKQLCELEDRIADKKHSLNHFIEKVNKTCSRKHCAQCINHNNCEMEYAE